MFHIRDDHRLERLTQNQMVSGAFALLDFPYKVMQLIPAFFPDKYVLEFRAFERDIGFVYADFLRHMH